MLDNLLEPIRRIKIDQNEFAGARAVFFLNPGNFEYGNLLSYIHYFPVLNRF